MKNTLDRYDANTRRSLKPGRYCEHGAIVPGAGQYLALAVAKEHAEKIAVCIDWCDECMGVNRKESE